MSSHCEKESWKIWDQNKNGKIETKDKDCAVAEKCQEKKSERINNVYLVTAILLGFV
jgi:hypothetical protein